MSLKSSVESPKPTRGYTGIKLLINDIITFLNMPPGYCLYAFYRAPTKLPEDNVFIGVCLPFCSHVSITHNVFYLTVQGPPRRLPLQTCDMRHPAPVPASDTCSNLFIGPHCTAPLHWHWHLVVSNAHTVGKQAVNIQYCTFLLIFLSETCQLESCSYTSRTDKLLCTNIRSKSFVSF